MPIVLQLKGLQFEVGYDRQQLPPHIHIYYLSDYEILFDIVQGLPLQQSQDSYSKIPKRMRRLIETLVDSYQEEFMALWENESIQPYCLQRG